MAAQDNAFALDQATSPAVSEADTQRRKKLSAFGLQGLQQYANADQSTADLQEAPLHGGELSKDATQGADEPSQLATERVQRAPAMQAQSPLLNTEQRAGNVLTGEEGQFGGQGGYGPMSSQQRSLSLKDFFGPAQSPSSTASVTSADVGGAGENQTAADLGKARSAIGYAGRAAGTLKGLFSNNADEKPPAGGSGVSASDILRSGAGYSFPLPSDVLSGASGGARFTGDANNLVPFQIPSDVLGGASGGSQVGGSGLPSGGELGTDFAGGGAYGGDASGFGNPGLGGIIGGLSSLLGIGQGVAQGGKQGALSAARGGTGLLSALQSLFFPETSALSIIGNSLGTAGIGAGAGAAAAGVGADMAASSLGALAPYVAPIIQSIGTGLNIADRSDKGIPVGDQAGMAAIDLLTQGIPIAGGALAGALDNLFYAHYPSHEQRDTQDEIQGSRELQGALGQVGLASSYQELADALTPLFSNQYKKLPYALPTGVGTHQYDMGPEGMRSMPNRDELAALFAGDDPNAINFAWQQGIRPEATQMMGSALTSGVRNQAAIIRAALGGDPQAQELLKQFAAEKQWRWQGEQDKARQMYYDIAHPWEKDPSWFQNNAQQGGGSGGGSDGGGP